MKRIISLILSITLLTGCSVSKINVSPSNASIDEVELSFVLFEDVSSSFEEAAEKYHSIHPQISFKIQRYPDDETYRVRILEQLHSNPPTVFSIGGQADLDYFFKDAEKIPLPITPLTEAFSKDGVLYALPITLYGYGIIYNSRILSVMGIDPSSFATLDGLRAAVETINAQATSYGVSKAVCSQTDLEEIAVTAGLDGDGKTSLSLSPNIQTLLSLAGTEQAGDPAEELTSRWAVMYFGGSEILSLIKEIDPELATDMAIAPLPIQDNATLIEASDFVIINNQATQMQKSALKDFFTWLFCEYDGNYPLSPYTPSPTSPIEEDILSRYQSGDYTTGKASVSPAGYDDEFSLLTEQLRMKQIDWGSYINALTEYWIKGKKIE